MIFQVFVPKQATGASLIYFDLWVPTGSQRRIEVLSCMPVVSGAVAVVGTLAVDLHLQRTTAIGTGGTAMVVTGNSITAMAISGRNTNQAWDLGDMSGRLTPTGGATAGAVLGFTSVMTEETFASSFIRGVDLAGSERDETGPIVVSPGTGISVVQGSVASVGNIAFSLIIRSNRF